MGIEIHIAVAHNLSDLSLVSVVDQFRTLDNIFGEISEYYAKLGFKHPYRTWAVRDMENWQREWDRQFYGRIPIGFDAPAGFSFYFGPHVVCIHHHTRLSLFCSETEIRQLLRRFTWQVLCLLSVDRAIYSPDDYGVFDMIFEGKTLSDIESDLFQLAKPASSLAELESQLTPPRYYIDRYEDFYVEKTHKA